MSHLSNLEASDFNKNCLKNEPDIIIHFTPNGIIETDEYSQWMASFSPSTSHLIINEKNECLGIETAHKLQYKLNLLSPSIFPILKDKSIRISEENEYDIENHEINKNLNNNLKSWTKDGQTLKKCDINYASTGLIYNIRPLSKFDR